jgi:hypothetical protein
MGASGTLGSHAGSGRAHLIIAPLAGITVRAWSGSVTPLGRYGCNWKPLSSLHPGLFRLSQFLTGHEHALLCVTLTYDRGKDAAKHKRQSEKIEAGHPRRRSI